MSSQVSAANAGSYVPGRDDELVIETPERVELYYTRAQIGNRFLAALVDHLLQFLMIGAIVLVAAIFWDAIRAIWDALGQFAVGIAIMVAFAIYSGYFVLFETIWNGQTPGKKLFRLRVIREDGRPVRFYEALVRNLLRTALDSMPVVGVPLYSIGIVAVFLSPRSKRIGDYVAGTVVIREAETKAASIEDIQSLVRAEQDRAWAMRRTAFTIDPDLITNEDFAAMRGFLRRRHDLPEAIRTSLANRIAASLAVRLNVPPLSMTAEQVLEEIDRQSRTKRSYSEAVI